MFSYCNRNNSVQDKNKDIFTYATQDYKFQHKPWLCNGSFQQQKQGRGVPSNLIDLNSKIRGQGSMFQENCRNDTPEIQFQSLRPMPYYARTEGPSMTVTSYTTESTAHRDNINISRPTYGHPDMMYTQSDKI
jgi:hypothetical protein